MQNRDLAKWLPEIFDRTELTFEPSLWLYDRLPASGDFSRPDAEQRWTEASGEQPMPTIKRTGGGGLR